MGRTAWAAGAMIAAVVAAVSGARAQSDLCADPAGVCQARLPASCLAAYGAGSVGAGAASDDAQCGPALAAYQECLAEVAATCGGPAPSVDDAFDARAQAAWEAVKDSGDPDELAFVAERYPGTFWGDLAAKRAGELREGATPVGAGSTPGPAPAAPTRPAQMTDFAGRRLDCANTTTMTSYLNEYTSQPKITERKVSYGFDEAGRLTGENIAFLAFRDGVYYAQTTPAHFKSGIIDRMEDVQDYSVVENAIELDPNAKTGRFSLKLRLVLTDDRTLDLHYVGTGVCDWR